MAQAFLGKKIRDEILADLAIKITRLERKPTLAVFLVGNDPVSVNYVGLKQRLAEKIGIQVKLFHYQETTSENDVLQKIKELNQTTGVDGIMVQIPLPAHFNREKIVEAISPAKDVDGLRYCLNQASSFLPPVVLAIAKALEGSAADLENKSVLIIGHGFLVGDPLRRFLLDQGKTKRLIVLDQPAENLATIAQRADVIISATGQAGLVSSEMVSEGVVLIDAGTSEVGGELRGDIDPAAYQKSSFYSPVPGGIGPVTVAMLMSNLVGAGKPDVI